MIDFACKRFNLDEIIKCGLGLTKSDYKILKFLVGRSGHFSSGRIATKVGVDLSTAQRSLKKLREKELIVRGQENLSPGGYVYYYSGREKGEIKKIILEIARHWSSGVEKALGSW